jgi:hypothetical protein
LPKLPNPRNSIPRATAMCMRLPSARRLCTMSWQQALGLLSTTQALHTQALHMHYTTCYYTACSSQHRDMCDTPQPLLCRHHPCLLRLRCTPPHQNIRALIQLQQLVSRSGASDGTELSKLLHCC